MDDLQRHLEAARGWLTLGAPQEAAAELDALVACHLLDLEVLRLRVRVYRHLEDWTCLESVARRLYEHWHNMAEGHLALATATRHLRGPERALGILMEATELFPHEAAVYYDLACCEALCGNVDLARGWLNEAYRLAPELGKAARADGDLAVLRGEVCDDRTLPLAGWPLTLVG